MKLKTGIEQKLLKVITLLAIAVLCLSFALLTKPSNHFGRIVFSFAGGIPCGGLISIISNR